MRPYEVVVIFDVGLEEEQIKAVLDRSVGTIKAAGGSPGRIDRWGRRRFAYRLQNRWEGYYVLLEVTAEPAAVTELDRQLRLTDGVLRHKVIRIPDHVAGRERRSLKLADDGPQEPEKAEAGAEGRRSRRDD